MQSRQSKAVASVGYQNADNADLQRTDLYRDQSETEAKVRAQNIMYDKRVVRGSTFAIPVVPASVLSATQAKKQVSEDRRKRKALEAERSSRRQAEIDAQGPAPVDGRRHMDVQTDTYLEVLIDREPEEEIGVQTDAALDRPPSPLFIPRSSGIDAETQILPGDLFDFDFEVDPLLDVLVGKTLEQALLEASHEDELAAIRERQSEFEAIRAAELAEVQRLEAEVKRRFAEKQRRKAQEEARLKNEAEVREKVAAAAYARSYLSSLRRQVFQHLHESGHFYDPVKREIEAGVLPNVLSAVSARLTDRQSAVRPLADEIILSAVDSAKRRFLEYQAKLQADREAAEAAAAAQAAAKAAEDAAAAAAAASAAAAEGADGNGEATEEAESEAQG